MWDSRTMDNVIAWTTKAGAEIKIEVAVNFELTTRGTRKTEGRKQVDVTATIDGAEHRYVGGVRKLATPQNGCVAAIGQIGLTEERYARLSEMKAEANKIVEAHNSSINAHAEALDAIGSGNINQWNRFGA